MTAAPGRSKTGLRQIKPAFVVAPPSGRSTKDRLHLSEEQAQALARIGSFLGELYRADYQERAAAGRLTAAAKADSRKNRKRNLTASTSSRWAGAITRRVEDQYQLGMRALYDEARTLRSAIGTLSARVVAPVGAHVTSNGRKVHGYRSEAERFQKTRRLSLLRQRAVVVEASLKAQRPKLVHGGGRLWRNRENLNEAGMTPAVWRQRWDAARWFLTADGETGKKWGNETIRVTPDGDLHVKVPNGLVNELGNRLVFPGVLNLSTHRAEDWVARIHAHQAVGYRISFDPAKRRWYLHAAWSLPDTPTPPLETLRAQRTLALDLNDQFLAGWVIDASGNPVGEPLTFTVAWEDLTTTARDAALRHAITQVLKHARRHGCASITVEDLNFADARATGRETMGRGARGKRFRRTVAGIPTGKFRDRLTAMAHTVGLPVIAVDPAYTSAWGGQHWQKPLTKTHRATSRHHAAAVVIGRRGHGYSARRRKEAPAVRQRTTRSQRFYPVVAVAGPVSVALSPPEPRPTRSGAGSKDTCT